MIKIRTVAAAALLTCTLGAWAAPAQAQMVKAQDPQGIIRALQAAGYSATLGVDGTGDPMITSGVGGSKFQVFFYNCTDHKACATVQFHIGYDLSTSPGLQSINEWNSSQRFGRAHLDKENDPILEMDLDLDDGGMSQALFEDNLEFWASVVGRFEKHIGYSK
ncbi:MAG: YbjN domain-containing protein [Sphingomonas sp.]|uniref:YbjN domain-containing protein n=1 Tax=Sphingomonas sp. TaxID=28214 RepID=UPI001B0BBCC3|nr:YbjN domain-containing protein [Sphingomonas sp.]MBO9623072.1 YbjN domain-containing protein [Sphingomonas sp.]